MAADKKDPQIIDCQDSLDISIVSALGNELKAALDSGQAVQLQAAEVGRADTAALQLLCAFFLDAKTQGIEVEWLDPSDALIHAASIIGLTEYLGLKEITLH